MSHDSVVFRFCIESLLALLRPEVMTSGPVTLLSMTSVQHREAAVDVKIGNSMASNSWVEKGRGGPSTA